MLLLLVADGNKCDDDAGGVDAAATDDDDNGCWPSSEVHLVVPRCCALFMFGYNIRCLVG